MAVITPPSIGALPTAPDPADRATFNARAYPWSVALGPFSTQLAAVAANVEHNATEAATSATNAATQAGNAATSAGTATTQAGIATAQAVAAAASAASASNATNVNGTSTDSESIPTLIGQQRTFTMVESSRDIVPGMFLVAAVTASPTTNWALFQVDSFASNTWTGTCKAFGGSGTFSAWTVSLSSARGPAGADAVTRTPSLALSGTPTLTVGNNGYTGDVAAGTAIALDTLATLGDGWSIILVPTSGAASTVTADFGAGSVAKTLVTATLISVKLVSGTYTVRWLPFSRSPATLGTPSTAAVINSYASDGCLASCALTSTHSMVVLRTASNTARVAMIDFTTAPPTIGAMETITTDLGTGRAHIARVTDNQALVVFRESGSLRALAVDRTGNTITTPLNAEAEVHANGLSPALCAVTATKFACAYVRGTYYTCIKTIDVTGSAVAANTEYIVRDDTGGTYSQYVFAVSAVSASKVLLSYNNTVGEYLAGLALSGDTFSASHELGRGASNAQNHGVTHAVMPDGRVAVIGGSSHSTGAGMTHSVRAFTVDWSGVKIVLSPITSVGDAYMAHLQAALLSSGYIVLIGREQLGNGGYNASVLERVDDIIKLVSGRGIKASVSGSAYIGGVFQVSGARLAVIYQNLENSSYPEVLTIPLNTAT